MARVFLTGATGYLGCCLRESLAAAGHVQDWSPRRLADLEPRSIEADYVVHAAAAVRGTKAHERLAARSEAAVHAANVDATRRLMAAVKPGARVILVSSKSVYGTAERPVFAAETASTTPHDAYARSKLEAEAVVRAEHPGAVVLRPATFFGHAHGRYGPPSVVAMTDALLRRGEVPVKGGDQPVDYLYVRDLAGLVERLCSGDWKTGATLNVPGEIVTVEAMAKSMISAAARLGIAGGIVREPPPARLPVVLRSEHLPEVVPGWTPTPAREVIAGIVAGRARAWSMAAAQAGVRGSGQ